MAITPIISPGLLSTSQPDTQAVRLDGRTPEVERQRLRKATRDFESLFVYQMLQAMRKTVGESSFAKGAPLSGSLGKDTFMDMFDMHLAREIAGQGKGSIADLLYDRLVDLMDGPPEVPNPPTEPVPLRDEDRAIERSRPAIELPRQSAVPLSVSASEFRLEKRTDRNDSRGDDAIWKNYGDIIQAAAADTTLDSALITAVIKVESDGDANAVSTAGAKGLMQLTDDTARELGVRRVFDPHENIRSGSRYLKRMLDRFGNLRLALAAYNAGPGMVERHGGIPPFPETRSYVDRVLAAVTSYRESIASPAKGP